MLDQIKKIFLLSILSLVSACAVMDPINPIVKIDFFFDSSFYVKNYQEAIFQTDLKPEEFISLLKDILKKEGGENVLQT